MVRSNIRRLNWQTSYLKAVKWTKLVTITSVVQIIIQVTGFLSGILIIRLLSIQQYALYTLANTILGTMIILADGGVGTGVMAQGGKVWQDRKKLGAVVATGLDLRKKFAIVSVVIATPILVTLLRHHKATWLICFLILLSLIPSFYITLSSNLLQIVPKLKQDLIPLQKSQLVSNVIRFILLVPSLIVFPLAFIAILLNGLPLILLNRNLIKVSKKHAELNQKSDPMVKKEILRIVSRLLPDSIYYCLTSQITIWLISIFGSTSALAELGALGRLGMILNLITVIITTLVAPRFARLPSKRSLLFTRFFQIQGILFILSALIIFFVWLFPSEVLWIMGEKYSKLRSEVLLIAISNCLGLINGASFSLCTFRGWTINPLIFIPISILSIVIGAVMINVSTLKGIISLDIFVLSNQVIMLISYNLIEINKSKKYSLS